MNSFAALTLFVSLAQTPSIPPEALEAFRQGEALIGTDSAYTARQAGFFRKAVELAPDWTAAQFNLALVLLAMNQPSDAVEHLDQVVRLDPQNPKAYLLRGEAFMQLGKPTKAELDFRKCTELDPADPDGWHARGRLENSRQDPTAALEYLDKTLQVDPQRTQVQLERGVALQRLGRKAEAAQAFQAFLEGFPAAWEVRMMLGELLVDLGRSEEALQAFRGAELQSGGDAEVVERIAWFLLQNGKFAEAETQFAKLPDTTERLANRGFISSKLEKPEQAIGFFRKALAAEPNNAEIWVRLADVYFYEKRDAESLEAYEKAQALGISDAQMFLNAGIAAANVGENEKSAGLLQRAVEADPQSADATFYLAVARDRLNEAGEARKLYEKARELGSQQPWIDYRLCFMLAAEGNAEAALDSLQRALEKDAARFLPAIDNELLKVTSPLDSIRYTERFSGMLAKYRASVTKPSQF